MKTSDIQNAQQRVANWFASRLKQIKGGNGYPLTFQDGDIHVDDDAPTIGSPNRPQVVYNDDYIEYKQAEGKGRIVSFQPIVTVSVRCDDNDYKRVARRVWASVTHACKLSRMQDDDAPAGVVSITPVGSRRSYDGGARYVQVDVLFQVAADDVARFTG